MTPKEFRQARDRFGKTIRIGDSIHTFRYGVGKIIGFNDYGDIIVKFGKHTVSLMPERVSKI